MSGESLRKEIELAIINQLEEKLDISILIHDLAAR